MKQHEKVLKILIKRGKDGNWVQAPEFIQYGDIYVGYKAPTRIAELSNDYPEMIKRRKVEGKRYFEYKFNFGNEQDFLSKIPKNYRDLVILTLKEEDMAFKKYVVEAVYLPNGNVEMVRVLKDG